MDLEHDARRLLDRIGVLRHACDLDLLVFLARHPRTLLASEQLSVFLGHGVKKVAASLDILVGAGFITRTPNPVHAARMYVFSVDGPSNGWLPDLIRLASTRPGRLAMISAMRRGASGGAVDSETLEERGSTGPGPRGSFIVMPIQRPHERRSGGKKGGIQ